MTGPAIHDGYAEAAAEDRAHALAAYYAEAQAEADAEAHYLATEADAHAYTDALQMDAQHEEALAETRPATTRPRRLSRRPGCDARAHVMSPVPKRGPIRYVPEMPHYRTRIPGPGNPGGAGGGGMTWTAPEPSAEDPAGAYEEAILYADLEDSLRTWARSWPASPSPRERAASHDEPEAGL